MAAKFLTVLAFAACTLAEPYYGSYGYAGYGYPAYGLGYGYRSTGVARHAGGGISYTSRSTQGLGKRSADAEPGYLGYGGYAGYGYGYPAYGVYGYGARSYEYRSPQGLGKRSADAEPGYLGYGYGYPAYGYGYYGYGRGIAGHPGGATSFVARSPQGLRGKRSAEPEPFYGYGYGRVGSYQEVIRPYANSAYRVNDRVYGASVYEDNFNGFNGLRGKRSAEPEPFYGYGVGSYQRVSRPGSSYAVNDRVAYASVDERSARYGAAYGYGFNSGYYG